MDEKKEGVNTVIPYTYDTIDTYDTLKGNKSNINNINNKYHSSSLLDFFKAKGNKEVIWRSKALFLSNLWQSLSFYRTASMVSLIIGSCTPLYLISLPSLSLKTIQPLYNPLL